MITTLKPLIKTILQNISTLSFVYDYHEEAPDWYPVASFEIARITNDTYDSCNNKVTFEFDIVIQQEVGKLSTRPEARVIMDSTIDEIIEEINQDVDLGGATTRTYISAIDCGSILLDKWEILYSSIRLVCETLDFNK